MKTNINTDHNSIEIDFEGAKPGEELRELMKAYGFWWFGKNKLWVHSLAIDPEFFKDFVETRIKPLATVPAKATTAAAVDLSAMSEEDKQALLAALMAAK